MKKINDKNGNIGILFLEFIIGILLLINPEGLTKTVILLLGIMMILSSIMSIIGYFKTDPNIAFKENSLSKGLFYLAFGLFCIFKSNWFNEIFPILTTLYGILILFIGLQKIEWAVDGLRLKRKYWFVAGISAILSIIFGVIIINNPFSSTSFIWIFTGIVFILESIADIISLVLDNKNN